MTDVMARLLRIENLWVVALLLVAVLVALEARWRGDPRRRGTARAIKMAIRAGFVALVVTDHSARGHANASDRAVMQSTGAGVTAVTRGRGVTSTSVAWSPDGAAPHTSRRTRREAGRSCSRRAGREGRASRRLRRVRAERSS